MISLKKSFSPSINRELSVKSLKTITPNDLLLCNDILKINLGTINKPYCLNYDNNKVTKKLLENLKYSKHLKVSKLIPPRQLMSNCWFNTMFVIFFFSDKGRKFFRFFRELMIKGRKTNGEKIPKEIHKIFFVLNLFIEASYNNLKSKIKTKKVKNKLKNNVNMIKQKPTKKLKKTYNKKNEGLMHQINALTENLNTNFYIYHLYKIIKNSTHKITSDNILSNKISKFSLPNINDPGNPLEYYETIFKYLNYKPLRLLKVTLSNKFVPDLDLHDNLLYEFKNYENIPNILIIEDFESGQKFDKKYNFLKNGIIYNYQLDSIIITNRDHFNKYANSHFVSVLTINKKEYKFDGSSYSRLTLFKWKDLINQNKDWSFRENPNYYPEVYNFTKGYKIMFYYRC